MNRFLLILSFLFCQIGYSQTTSKLYDIIDGITAQRIEKDVITLANFRTRNTFSDTISNTEGIGAARRWIKSEFESISKQ